MVAAYLLFSGKYSIESFIDLFVIFMALVWTYTLDILKFYDGYGYNIIKLSRDVEITMPRARGDFYSRHDSCALLFVVSYGYSLWILFFKIFSKINLDLHKVILYLVTATFSVLKCKSMKTANSHCILNLEGNFACQLKNLYM